MVRKQSGRSAQVLAPSANLAYHRRMNREIDLMNSPPTDIAAALQARTRLQQLRYAHETPDERLARFARLQNDSFTLLCSSPTGLQHFLHRNLHSRRVKVIDGMWRPISADRRAVEA